MTVIASFKLFTVRSSEGHL